MLNINFFTTQELSSEIQFSEVKECYDKQKYDLTETFFTSGTSGEKKEFKFSQKQILSSVNQTLSFFGLKPCDTIVNALPLNFVAGKMNVYRAIYGKLNYIQIPAINIDENLPNENIDFIALVPNQLSKLLDVNIDLSRIKKILIGGGEWVDFEILKKMKSTQVFQSFASTETLTHFAIKQIYPKLEEDYTILNDFQVQQINDQLFVQHQEICKDGIFLDDIIQKTSFNTFKWIGRTSNMIKSGGIKIFPELIEKKLSNFLNQKFVILGLKNEVYGEICVLCIEGSVPNNIDEILKNNLPQYEIPKKVISIKEFPFTESGKIKRNSIIIN